MAIEDVVTLTITRESRPVERAGFGTLLFLAMHRAWDDRIKYYTQPDDLLDDGFSETDPCYLAAVAYFSQEPKPQTLGIGRLATDDGVTVVIDTVEAAARYTIWLDGVGFDASADSTPTTIEIEAALTTVVNDGYAITTAATSTKKFTIASNHRASFPVGAQFRVSGSTGNDGTYTVAGVALVAGATVVEVSETVASAVADGAIKSLTPVTATNTIAGDAGLSISPVTPAAFVQMWVGENMHLEFDLLGSITTNLTDIEAEDSTGWYAVCLAHQWETTASPAADDVQATVEEELATAIETRRKIFGIASPDANIVDTTRAADNVTTGSIARRLQDAGYARTWVLYSPEADDGAVSTSPDPYADVAWMGSRLPTDPGTETWKFASLTGVTADVLTTTQRTNALAKYANVYVPFTAAKSITDDGTVADGEFIDVIRLVDAIYDAVLTEVADVIVSPVSPLFKTPFTNAGIAAIEGAIRTALEQYTGPSRGLSSYTVTTPDEDDVSDADKGNRSLTGVSFTATVTGAVHAVTITGSVTV